MTAVTLEGFPRGAAGTAVAEAARLLPAGVPVEAREPIARAMLEVAAPLLPQDKTVRQFAARLLDLHQPLGPDVGQPMRSCLHCRWVWPCPSARIAIATYESLEQPAG